MTKFRIKGAKYSRMPIKWQGQKIHLNGGREYDGDKIPIPGGALSIPFEELQKQLRSNIIWTEYDDEKEKLIKQKEELIEQLEQKNQKIEELTDTLKRLQAELIISKKD